MIGKNILFHGPSKISLDGPESIDNRHVRYIHFKFRFNPPPQQFWPCWSDAVWSELWRWVISMLLSTTSWDPRWDPAIHSVSHWRWEATTGTATVSNYPHGRCMRCCHLDGLRQFIRFTVAYDEHAAGPRSP